MVCDLAQFYRIYDYHAVPVKTLAVLVEGLDSTSRVYRAVNGVKASPEVLLLAGIFDDLNALLWDGKHKKPERMLPTLYVDADLEKSRSEMVIYTDPQELMKRREEILRNAQKKEHDKDK